LKIRKISIYRNSAEFNNKTQLALNYRVRSYYLFSSNLFCSVYSIFTIWVAIELAISKEYYYKQAIFMDN